MVVEAERLPVERLAEPRPRSAETGDLRVALGRGCSARSPRRRAPIWPFCGSSTTRAPRRAGRRARGLVARRRGGRHAGACEAVARRRADRADPPRCDTGPGGGLVASPCRAGGQRRRLDRADPRRRGVRRRRSRARGRRRRAARARRPHARARGGRARGSGGYRLELAGEALAAGGDARRTAQQAVRIAVEATGARGGALWRLARRASRAGRLARLRSRPGSPAPRPVVAEASEQRRPAGIAHDSEVRQRRDAHARPAAVRGAAALLPRRTSPRRRPTCRRSRRSRRAPRTPCARPSASSELEVELERTRSLLEVVAEAISRLSLAHTLETGVERIAELLAGRAGRRLPAGRRPACCGRGPWRRAGERRRRRAARRSAAWAAARARRALQAGSRGPRACARRRARSRSPSAGQRSVLAVPLTAQRGVDRSARRLPGRAAPRRERDGAARRARGAARGRRAERAPARAGARAGGRARRRSSKRSARLASRERALRDLALVRPDAVARPTLAAVTETLVNELERRCRGDPRSRRARRPVRAARGPRRGLAARRRRSRDPRPPAAAPAAHARAHDARRRPVRAARRRPCAAASVPLGGADGRAAADRDAERAAGRADDPLARSGRRRSPAETLATARTIAPAGSARDRQRAALPAAEAVRGDDAAVAAAARAARHRRARGRRGLRVRRAGRRRWRRLRLPRARATAGSPSCSATSPGTASTRPPTWRWRSSCSARSRASIPSRPTFLAAANEVVVGEIAIGKFITMAYVTVDPRGEVLVCERRPSRAAARLGRRAVAGLACGGLALGIDAPQTYEQVARSSRRRRGRALHGRRDRVAGGTRALRPRAARRGARRERWRPRAGDRRRRRSPPAAASPAATCRTTVQSSSSAAREPRSAASRAARS